ncbi:MAG: hypothetical protein HQK76_09960 [Desulfobacterales bacterium]|nr:hypothetical protein [Desulfobacterales bacterium]
MNDNNKLRLKIGILLITLLSLIKFVFFPLHDWKKEKLENIEVLKLSVNKKRVLVGKESEITALADELKKNTDQFEKYFFSGFKDSQYLQLMLQKELEKIASSTGNLIKNIDWLYATEGDIYKAPITIQCEASPKKIIDLISKIESESYFLPIERLVLSSYGYSPNVIVEISVLAYGIPNKDSN